MIRKLIDRVLAKHNFEVKGYRGIYYIVSCTTDIMNGKRIKHGLGYNKEWTLEDSPRVICDLGCNTGLFPLWLYAQTGIKVRGLFVDANYSMVLRAREVLSLNKFDDCQVEYGLIGEPLGTKFYVYASHQKSSCYFPEDEYTDPGKGFTSSFSPPCLDIVGLWGDKEGDLLKIDIEGSEVVFLNSICPAFLRCFKKIIIEYHEPVSSSALIKILMKDKGFKHELTDGTTCGNTYWVRH